MKCEACNNLGLYHFCRPCMVSLVGHDHLDGFDRLRALERFAADLINMVVDHHKTIDRDMKMNDPKKVALAMKAYSRMLDIVFGFIDEYEKKFGTRFAQQVQDRGTED